MLRGSEGRYQGRPLCIVGTNIKMRCNNMTKVKRCGCMDDAGAGRRWFCAKQRAKEAQTIALIFLFAPGTALAYAVGVGASSRGIHPDPSCLSSAPGLLAVAARACPLLLPVESHAPFAHPGDDPYSSLPLPYQATLAVASRPPLNTSHPPGALKESPGFAHPPFTTMPKSVSSYYEHDRSDDDGDDEPHSLLDSSYYLDRSVGGRTVPPSPEADRKFGRSQRPSALDLHHHLPTRTVDESSSLLGNRDNLRAYATTPATPRPFAGRHNSSIRKHRTSRRPSFSNRLVDALGVERQRTLGTFTTTSPPWRTTRISIC